MITVTRLIIDALGLRPRQSLHSSTVIFLSHDLHK